MFYSHRKARILGDRLGLSFTRFGRNRDLRRTQETRNRYSDRLFTADAKETIRQAALEAGADAFLIKPDDLEKVVSTVTSLIDARNKN